MPDSDAFDRVMMDLYARGARDQNIPHLPHPETVKRIIVFAHNRPDLISDLGFPDNPALVRRKFVLVNSMFDIERIRGVPRESVRYLNLMHGRSMPRDAYEYINGYGIAEINLENARRWLSAQK